MRKTIVIGVTFFTVLLFLMLNLHSAIATPVGWSDDVRMTFNGLNRYPTIEVDGSNVHIIWENGSDGELYYRKSIDYGNTWTSDTNITRTAPDPILPDIAINGSTIHVVCEDIVSSRSEIFYLRSEDNGQSWTEQVVLSENNASESKWPSVGCEGNNVYVVWGDQREGEYEIYFKNSSDGGNTWSNDKRLTFHQTGTDDSPAIIATPTKLHLVYMERTGGTPSTGEVMYMNSTDGGSSWSTPVMLSSDNDAHSIFVGPNGFDVDGNNIHVVWEDQRHGDGGEVYYRNSTDGGLSWNPEVRLTNQANRQEVPKVCAENDVVHIFWQDDRDKGQYYGNIYTMNSTDGGNTWNPEFRVKNEPWPTSTGISGAQIDDGYTHIIFRDNRTGDNSWEVYYKRNPDFASPIPEFSNLLAPVMATIFIVGVVEKVYLRKRK